MLFLFYKSKEIRRLSFYFNSDTLFETVSTKIVLRLYDPTYKTWVDAQELSGTATSVTFSFGMWIDSDGYVKCGVIPYNDYGSGGGSAKVYDTKNKKWIN